MTTATEVERTKLRDLTLKVAAAMGEGWRGEVDDSDGADRDPWCARIHGPEGACVFLSATWGPRGMLHASGSIPNEAYRITRVENTWINMAWTKTPEQMARDITRRLLPAYLPELQKAQACIDHDREYRAGKVETARRAAAILGGELPTRLDDDRDIHVYRTRARSYYDAVAVGPDRVSLKVDLTTDQLARMVAALPDVFGPPEGGEPCES